MTFDSDVTPKSRRGIKISDPIPIQHNHSLDSIVEPDSTTVWDLHQYSFKFFPGCSVLARAVPLYSRGGSRPCDKCQYYHVVDGWIYSGLDLDRIQAVIKWNSPKGWKLQLPKGNNSSFPVNHQCDMKSALDLVKGCQVDTVMGCSKLCRHGDHDSSILRFFGGWKHSSARFSRGTEEDQWVLLMMLW